MITAASALQEIDCEIARFEKRNSTHCWSTPLQYFHDAQMIASGALSLVPGAASAKTRGFTASGKNRLLAQSVTPLAL